MLVYTGSALITLHMVPHTANLLFIILEKIATNSNLKLKSLNKLIRYIIAEIYLVFIVF